ncbi:hypothetical protein SASPL_128656 [Salvia splendens]|uniref:Shikimate O-hydroxycinnamoyltransferase n=1 Tax=Salvia splendens TaxID=180675 RepID=A0A8X8ZNR1_SALSN|nr:hypothetical protein SASPL_128656 [Salvia splendens]
MVGRLKTSLSDALVEFYPLAGRMKGQIFVDCNDAGILYVEAQAHAILSDIIKSPESGVLDKLTPFPTTGFLSTLQEPLAVQITSFTCGGIAIGMCISHRIADHYSLSSFTKCWAAIARRDDSSLISPVFNSAAQHARFLSKPEKPVAALKLEITTTTSIANPSRVVAVTAFLWSRCAAACKSDASVACHPVNIRGKIPSLTENSFGNLFQMVFAESRGEANWIGLAEKLRSAFVALDVARLLGERGFEVAKENFMEISKLLEKGNVDVFRFSSMCRFPVYEADFGWGKPVWVSYAGVQNKNCVFLFDSVDMERGGVEAWVVLTPQAMDRLQGDLQFLHFTSAFA